MQFNPNDVAQRNGNLVGLPFTEETAKVVLFPVPWEVTTSFSDGTALAADNIREASLQLDLYDADIPDAWKMGIYFQATNKDWLEKNKQLRQEVESYLAFLEYGDATKTLADFQALLDKVNQASKELNHWVYTETKRLLDKGKLVGLIGGEHSTPFGYYQALAERHGEFGILLIDAHCDLRKAYENFTHSHASIFYNALGIKEIKKIVQVGIRDYCEEEVEVIEQSDGRVKVFFDQSIREAQYQGVTFDAICDNIINALPQKVHISFDIDGLDPTLCPNTGTPVPGGLQYNEAIYLLKKLWKSGREIIGFDLCEVAGDGDFDGNVGARLAYKLSNYLGS